MCVIFVASKPLPQLVINQAYERNGDGAGIAWKDGDSICWTKGLDEEEITKACQEAPLPYIVHFRIATCGGTSRHMCHPFPIEPGVPIDTEGRTKSGVLFHNGHWTTWRSVLLNMIMEDHARLPPTKWSDSRALAYLATQYGLGSLDIIDEKCAVYTPEDIFLFGSNWTTKDGFVCSNLLWEPYKPTKADVGRLPAHYLEKFGYYPAGGKEVEAGNPRTFRRDQEAHGCGSNEAKGNGHDIEVDAEEVPKALEEPGTSADTIAWVRRLNPKLHRHAH